ncbi:MAG TPA: sulfite oxidase-like oxidoreductase [Acidimicrobiales bacterium]
MSFFERNRRELAELGIDPGRLPPGQYHTRRFPVLHVGPVPDYDLRTWNLRVFGAVEREHTFSWDELRALPATSVVTDIHCVTKWSKFDTPWTGVRFRDLFDLVGVREDARHVVLHAEYGYTTNVPLEAACRDASLVAYEYDGQPLAPEHGFPARALIPHLYFWKSAKWLRGIELTVEDRPGFWEQNGYHNVADPFLEQRFSDD